MPKVKVEVLVEAANVDKALELTSGVARTGSLGDGKGWLVAVDRLLRIRTGEEGRDAL